MFWEEDKIEDAHRIGRFLGPLGRMVDNDKDRLTNVCLYTIEHGKFWYGDINVKSDAEVLTNIAKTLKQDVYIIADSPIGGYDKPIHESAIRKIESK